MKVIKKVLSITGTVCAGTIVAMAGTIGAVSALVGLLLVGLTYAAAAAAAAPFMALYWIGSYATRSA